jgi:hypothetical protein
MDWTQLSPSRPDGHQIYVFGLHILVGITISILSFNGDWVYWMIGNGFFTPILLSGAGFFYGMARGMNWYRTEFLPFVNRNHTHLGFENDRFLSYARLHRISLLVSGYLATLVSQIVWTQLTLLSVPFIVSIPTLAELLFGLFILIFILFMAAWVFFDNLSNRLLRMVFSDITHLIDLDNDFHEALIAQKKNKAEK